MSDEPLPTHTQQSTNLITDVVSNGEFPDLLDHAKPDEDVREYLQRHLLPFVVPAIDKLLHHVAETGELQRALKQLENEKPQRKARLSAQTSEHLVRSHSSHSHTSHRERRDKEHKEGHKDKEHKEKEHRDKDHNHRDKDCNDREFRDSKDWKDSKDGTTSECESLVGTPHGDDIELSLAPFDPLTWLADHLVRFAQGPTEHYRPAIDQRIAELRQRRKREEEERQATLAMSVVQEEDEAAAERDDREDKDEREGVGSERVGAASATSELPPPSLEESASQRSNRGHSAGSGKTPRAPK